jgi:hypothetical protein
MRDVLALTRLATYSAAGFPALGGRADGLVRVEESM